MRRSLSICLALAGGVVSVTAIAASDPILTRQKLMKGPSKNPCSERSVIIRTVWRVDVGNRPWGAFSTSRMMPAWTPRTIEDPRGSDAAVKISRGGISQLRASKTLVVFDLF